MLMQTMCDIKWWFVQKYDIVRTARMLKRKVESDKEVGIDSQNDGSNEVWDFYFMQNFSIFSF